MAVIALTALLVTAGALGAVHASSRPSPLAALSALAPSAGTVCVLPANILTTAAPKFRVGAAPVHSRHLTTSGNLVVSIPATVFIRRAGHQLIVTTNTGRAPGPADAYYLIAGGRATVAGPGDRSRVESGCDRADHHDLTSTR